MGKTLKIAVFLILPVLIYSHCFCQRIDIEGLVDEYRKSTDIQKTKVFSDNKGKEITASGIVDNAGVYDFFNSTENIKNTYYQITTKQQKTKANTPYQVIFLFKDRDKVDSVNKDEAFQAGGKIIRLTDERLQIAVWILCAELSDKDKALFQ
ncbi:MAG: hypothetical protein FJZ12_01575 [Candidatus Omnitrophica bacterium]|nr:hypothetical protein [Candidatus Omnitrophota bacterium]